MQALVGGKVFARAYVAAVEQPPFVKIYHFSHFRSPVMVFLKYIRKRRACQFRILSNMDIFDFFAAESRSVFLSDARRRAII